MTRVEVKIDLELKNNAIAQNLVDILTPDFDDSSEKFERSKMALYSREKYLFVTIEAKDIVAAKASFNSIISWIRASNMILEEYQA